MLDPSTNTETLKVTEEAPETPYQRHLRLGARYDAVTNMLVKSMKAELRDQFERFLRDAFYHDLMILRDTFRLYEANMGMPPCEPLIAAAFADAAGIIPLSESLGEAQT